ncbi:MAG: arginine--tRNA ligase [Planctomycetia bacterium]|nr:arginine--tRNA ligase [Planctomycetia bacterium]
MNILAEIRRRFAAALAELAQEEPPWTAAGESGMRDLVRQSQDAKFGDYQANLAMPLAKQLARPPRDVAAQIVAHLDVADLCHEPQIAGPGFINLTLRDDWLAARLGAAVSDARLGIAPAAKPRTFIVDYSAPNVAKPMHVGHIRSTVIGDSLYRTLKFLGHRAIGDNHIGDWGTQFGMIIHGYKHFLDKAAYERSHVDELARLYRLVNQLVDYHEGRARLPELEKRVAEAEQTVAGLRAAPPTGDAKADKKAAQILRRAEADLAAAKSDLAEMRRRLAAVEADARLARLARDHAGIAEAVLAETAKLHADDAENLALWRQFMPDCMAAIQHLYDRLGVRFDETLGESFYHDRLRKVVDDLVAKGLARESGGAMCVFLEETPAPMIVQKRDGAFLYATSDLATIQYRQERWQPDALLYVVDHRQSLHFQQLFAAARLWGYGHMEFAHISFGTVLGDDGRPFKTRSGDTVGLEGLLDEAVERAHAIVSANDDAKSDGPELTAADRKRIAQTVGIAALKYADLSQNRTSDYVFSYDKMLAMNGNTATYVQYAYARVRSIFRRGGVDVERLRADAAPILLDTPAERALAVALVQFAEALEAVLADYRPNQLTTYLFELANRYSTFFDQCPVLKAPSEELRTSRLLLCDLTARTLAQGLALLGIDVVEQM